MHEIEMDEMSEAFFPCWQAAGTHLDKQVAGGIQSWLRAHPYPPVLEHLSFRLGNQLLFVRVEDVDGQVHGPGSLRGLAAIARGANGRACLMPMKRSMLGGDWVPDQPGWGLIDAATGQPIDPAALVTDEKIAMTHWEVHDMAVQVVRDWHPILDHHVARAQLKPAGPVCVDVSKGGRKKMSGRVNLTNKPAFRVNGRI